MPAAQVAGLACGEVREERFHILTHKKGSIEAIGHRLRGILANDPPHIKIRAPFRWSGAGVAVKGEWPMKRLWMTMGVQGFNMTALIRRSQWHQLIPWLRGHKRQIVRRIVGSLLLFVIGPMLIMLMPIFVPPMLTDPSHDRCVNWVNERLHAQAEPFCKGALAIREKTLGPDHPSTAASLGNLAGLYSRPTTCTPKPSRSICAPWRSARKPSALTTPAQRPPSATSPGYTPAKTCTPKPSRSTNAPWRSKRKPSALTT